MMWGIQYVAVKITNEGISPVLQGGLRSAFAAVLLFIWMLYKKEPFFEKDRSFLPGVLLGLLFSAEFILVYLGISYTNASRAAIFLYTSPFFVCWCGRGIFRITFWRYIRKLKDAFR